MVIKFKMVSKSRCELNCLLSNMLQGSAKKPPYLNVHFPVFSGDLSAESRRPTPCRVFLQTVVGIGT